MSFIEYLVENYSDTVFRTALVYLRSPEDAEDAVSEVLEKYLRAAVKPDDSEPERLKAWLIRTTVNHCKDILRSSAHRLRSDMPETLTAGQEDRDMKLDVENALYSLPPKYRVPVYLFYYEGYDTAEIGSILGLPKGTVTSRLSRAREKLRPYLSGYGREDGT